MRILQPDEALRKLLMPCLIIFPGLLGLNGALLGQGLLRTTVNTTWLIFDQGTTHDDPTPSYDLDSELFVQTTWDHPEIGASQSTEIEGDLNMNWAQGRYHTSRRMEMEAALTECAPYDQVAGSGEVWELDQSIASSILGAVSLISSIGALFASPTGGGAVVLGWVSATTGGISVSLSANGNDHLGTLPARKFGLMPGTDPDSVADDIRWNTKPNPKKGTLATAGNPRLYLNVSSTTIAGECPSRGSNSQRQRGASIDIPSRFAALRDAIAGLPHEGREPGASRLTIRGERALRDVAERAAVGLARALATEFVAGSLEYVGGASALAELDSGEAAWQADDWTTALDFYEAAVIAAVDAIEGGFLLPTPIAMSERVVLGSPFLTSLPSNPPTLSLYGRVFGLPTGTLLQDVSVDAQGVVPGLDAGSAPGARRRVVAVEGSFANAVGGIVADELIGLARFSATRVSDPDAGCPLPHLEDGTPDQSGVFFDDEGPYFDPDPAGCSFGPVTTTLLAIEGGATPPGVDYGAGVFRVDLAFAEGTELPFDSLSVEIEALLGDPGGSRSLTTSFELVVPAHSAAAVLFDDDFEDGNLGRWSAVSQ